MKFLTKEIQIYNLHLNLSLSNFFAPLSLGKASKKTFFWEISPKSVYPPTHPRVFVRFGKTKVEIRVEKGDFRGYFQGFGPCLGISHPTHPPLGEISQKNVFLDAFPYCDLLEASQMMTS